MNLRYKAVMNKGMGLKGRILYKFGGVVFLLLAINFIVVIIGLYTSKRLSGDAAEINYAGSVRMRSFKIGFLLNEVETASKEEWPQLKREIEEERVCSYLMMLKPKICLPKNKSCLSHSISIIYIFPYRK